MPDGPFAQCQYLDEGDARFMKAAEALTQGAKTSARPSVTVSPRNSKLRYRPLLQTEPGSHTSIPNDLQTHLAKGRLMLDLLDLARDLGENVTIPRSETAVFEKVALAQIRRNFSAISQRADQLFFGINGPGHEPLLELRAIDIHEAIAAIVKDLGSQRARKEIFFDLQLEALDYHAYLEPETFHHLLTDLILAAIKFAPNEGLIYIASYNTSPNAIVVSVCDNELNPKMEVSEPGFLPLAGQEAADRFKNDESSQSLAVARSLVETYRCTLAVESPSRGAGPTFLLKLETTAAPADLASKKD